MSGKVFLMPLVLTRWDGDRQVSFKKDRDESKTFSLIEPYQPRTQSWQTVLSIFSFGRQKFGWPTVMERAKSLFDSMVR